MTLIPHNKDTEWSFISYEYSYLHGLFANHGSWAFNVSNICKTPKAVQPLTWFTKNVPISCDFSACPACFIYLSHALWSMQTGYDLWHSATCVPYFLCERNKWQAWRLKTGLPFSFCLPVFGSFFFPTSFFFS